MHKRLDAARRAASAHQFRDSLRLIEAVIAECVATSDAEGIDLARRSAAEIADASWGVWKKRFAAIANGADPEMAEPCGTGGMSAAATSPTSLSSPESEPSPVADRHGTPAPMHQRGGGEFWGLRGVWAAAALLAFSLLGGWVKWQSGLGDWTQDEGLPSGSGPRVAIGLLLAILVLILVIRYRTSTPRARLYFAAAVVGVAAILVRGTFQGDGLVHARTVFFWAAWLGAILLVLSSLTAFVSVLRTAGPDPDSLRNESNSLSSKTCPDCAEMVRTAARVCRFCGYRFPEVAPSPTT